MSDTERPEDKWPAVLFAYDFVLPSYQMMATRIEATVTRVQAMMTFAATLTLGLPVLGQAINKGVAFISAPFIISIIFFIVLMILGIVARDIGDFMLVNPDKLYEKSLHLSEWEFKRDAIAYAGQSFSHNAALANKKADLGRAMSVLLLAEVVTLLTWIAAGS